MSHIEDDSLELYALARVPQSEAVSTEEHLLVCPSCRERLQAIAEFAHAAREATQIIVTELIASHRTKDGLVHLYVRPQGPDTWLATIRGENLDGGISACSRAEAVERSLSSFKLMFPEHQCGKDCSNPVKREA